MKFNKTLTKFVKKDIEEGLIPMLLGEPGIGKSSWLIDLARETRTECFVLACNQLADKADLTGARLVPITDKDGNITDYKQMFYPHAVIHDAIEYAEKHPRENPILFLDELNRTTPDVTSEALSIPTLRSIGSKKLPNNLRVVIAGNDKGNVTALDEASISRFVLYKVEPDTNTFLGLDNELNPFVKNVLEAHPEVIFGKTIKQIKDDDEADVNVDIEDIIDDGEDMAQITTPRTISGISKWLNTFTNDELLEALADTKMIDGEPVSVLQEAIEGHVGKTSFAAFLYAEIAENITTTSNQENKVLITKPKCYDDMKKCTDMTSLNEFVSDMTPSDRSGAIVYAIYEKEDNTPYIQALAPVIDSLTSEDTKALMSAKLEDKLDNENVATLLSTNTDIADSLKLLLNS